MTPEYFTDFDATEHRYWFVSDGAAYGTEIVWLPRAQRFAYYDLDAHEGGTADQLTLIQSRVDGDASGLHNLADLIACDLGSNCGVWIVTHLPEDFSLPGDAQVWEIDSEGLEEVAVGET